MCRALCWVLGPLTSRSPPVGGDGAVGLGGDGEVGLEGWAKDNGCQQGPPPTERGRRG